MPKIREVDGGARSAETSYRAASAPRRCAAAVRVGLLPKHYPQRSRSAFSLYLLDDPARVVCRPCNDRLRCSSIDDRFGLIKKVLGGYGELGTFTRT
ncbi:hypothetical protein ACQEVC_24570 [Plantactinospora sp. CA-294935]|uniref:hypothetical protein n=1 Tax=Plantactinospora sp. CA-294935 TaxID=3240012 RepID=UPI003D8A1246